MKPSNMKLKSVLVDNLFGYETNHLAIDGIWYYAKPLFRQSLKRKLAWCLEILKGQAVAVHFKEDELAAEKRRSK